MTVITIVLLPKPKSFHDLNFAMSKCQLKLLHQNSSFGITLQIIMTTRHLPSLKICALEFKLSVGNETVFQTVSLHLNPTKTMTMQT